MNHTAACLSEKEVILDTSPYTLSALPSYTYLSNTPSKLDQIHPCHQVEHRSPFVPGEDMVMVSGLHTLQIHTSIAHCSPVSHNTLSQFALPESKHIPLLFPLSLFGPTFQ